MLLAMMEDVVGDSEDPHECICCLLLMIYLACVLIYHVRCMQQQLQTSAYFAHNALNIFHVPTGSSH